MTIYSRLALGALVACLTAGGPAAADVASDDVVICGNTSCANPWDCWTVSITYRELLTLPDINQPPTYRVRQIEFLNEPDNAWLYREDAECHARKAVREGIMRPLNFPENDQREYIPPSVIEKVRIWKIPMPDLK